MTAILTNNFNHFIKSEFSSSLYQHAGSDYPAKIPKCLDYFTVQLFS